MFTLVLWLGCLLVGAVGFALPYIRPQPAKQVETVKVEILDVELSNELAPPDFKPPPPDSPAAPPDALTQPSIPAPIPVARPSPAIAFAVPVEAPVRIVEPRSAAYTSVAAQTTADAPAPRALTFGQGEGRQPKPDYPLRARREGQEGSVTIRLTVGENGRVIAAEDVSPSPWPLLNESALRAVRERWRFSPGKLRRYEVSIRFELSK